MSVKIKGEITLGNGMVMVLDHNALVELEDALSDEGKGAFEVFDNLNKVKYVRAFYYACLKRHNPDITLLEAGDLMGEYPEALQEILAVSFPEAADDIKANVAKGDIAKGKK